MQELKQRLQRELLSDLHVSIVESGECSVPLQAIDVQYTPTSRVAMDVLMKMVLIVIRKLPISKAEQISELLHVELIFITDILHMLQAQRMITQQVPYALTTRGESQLAQGIFEQQLPSTKTTLLYSLVDQAFSTISLEAVEANEHFYAPLYDSAMPTLTDEQYCKHLTVAPHHIVLTIDEATMQQVYDVPCLYFVLYNKQEDSYYARAWHVLAERFDSAIEQKLNEKRPQWREKYGKNEG